MGGMVRAIQRSERSDLLQTVDIANGAVVNYAVSRFGVNGVAEVITDGRSVNMGAELVDNIYVSFHQHINRPGVLRFYTSVFFVAFCVEYAMDVGPSGNQRGGQRAAYKNTVWIDHLPSIFVLIIKVLGAENCPRFLQCHQFHALKQVVGDFWTAIWKSFALPFGRQKNKLFPGDLLGI